MTKDEIKIRDDFRKALGIPIPPRIIKKPKLEVVK